jgi:uncharacterized protein YozE (UPF0346 family)
MPKFSAIFLLQQSVFDKIWPNFMLNRPVFGGKIRPIIRLIRPNFVVLKFSYFFYTSTAFQSNFSVFNEFFQNMTESV